MHINDIYSFFNYIATTFVDNFEISLKTLVSSFSEWVNNTIVGVTIVAVLILIFKFAQRKILLGVSFGWLTFISKIKPSINQDKVRLISNKTTINLIPSAHLSQFLTLGDYENNIKVPISPISNNFIFVGDGDYVGKSLVNYISPETLVFIFGSNSEYFNRKIYSSEKNTLIVDNLLDSKHTISKYSFYNYPNGEYLDLFYNCFKNFLNTFEKSYFLNDIAKDISKKLFYFCIEAGKNNQFNTLELFSFNVEKFYNIVINTPGFQEVSKFQSSEFIYFQSMYKTSINKENAYAFNEFEIILEIFNNFMKCDFHLMDINLVQQAAKDNKMIFLDSTDAASEIKLVSILEKLNEPNLPIVIIEILNPQDLKTEFVSNILNNNNICAILFFNTIWKNQLFKPPLRWDFVAIKNELVNLNLLTKINGLIGYNCIDLTGLVNLFYEFCETSTISDWNTVVEKDDYGQWKLITKSVNKKLFLTRNELDDKLRESPEDIKSYIAAIKPIDETPIEVFWGMD